MKEQQIKQLGFKFEKEYTHDAWFTRRYRKDKLQVEFTYDEKTGKLITYDVLVEEGYIENPTFKTVKILSQINFEL